MHGTKYGQCNFGQLVVLHAGRKAMLVGKPQVVAASLSIHAGGFGYTPFAVASLCSA
jgi:hypothetical protein